MTDLSKIINDAVLAHMTPELVQKHIAERMTELVKHSIQDALCNYSANGKLIKAAIQDSLKIEGLDIPAYGVMVSSMLTAQIDELVSEAIAGQLKTDMVELLSIAPKSIKLSEIVQQMKEMDFDWEESWEEQFVTCVVEAAYSGSDSFIVKLDTKVSDRNFGYEVTMHITKDGKIISLSLSGTEMRETWRDRTLGEHIGPSYGIKQLCRAFYAAGTVIEIEEHSVDVSGKNYQ